MNYKECLLFVAKCLTITHEEINRKLVKEKIKSGKVDWDAVVKLSTAHYVFPALYGNLKRVDFLQYLPEDLVGYMAHITSLNRERNEQIIKQAKKINELLLSSNITPIFLKGTGNLLEGLYEDMGERMVGDIDFLVEKEKFYLTVNILKKNGYLENTPDFIENTILSRHYPRMIKKGEIAAVEVHYRMISRDHEFDHTFIKKSLTKLADNTTVLSYDNQVLLTCINKQINDKGQWFKTISLRNSYDLYLLSRLTSIKKILNNFNATESKYLDNFIAGSSHVFNSPPTLANTKTRQTEKFVNKQLDYLNTPQKSAYNRKKWDLYFLYKNRFSIVIKSFYKKEYRSYLFKKLKRLIG